MRDVVAIYNRLSPLIQASSPPSTRACVFPVGAPFESSGVDPPSMPGLYDTHFLILVPVNETRPAGLMAVSQTNVARDVPTSYTVRILDECMVYKATSASLHLSGDI